MRSAAACAALRSPGVPAPANSASILRSLSRSKRFVVHAGSARGSFRLGADRLEDRRPAHELVLEDGRRLVGADAEQRLEAEP